MAVTSEYSFGNYVEIATHAGMHASDKIRPTLLLGCLACGSDGHVRITTKFRYLISSFVDYFFYSA